MASNTKDDKRPDIDNLVDPQANLMTLMKDLYDKGDDTMKRTIAESWSKA